MAKVILLYNAAVADKRTSTEELNQLSSGVM